MIRTGLLKQGEKLVEKDLCLELGISRTPLREAYRLLSSEGLIDLVAHKGAYVARPSMREIRDMFEVMAILEGTCARLAAERMTDPDFKKVEKLHQRLEKHFEDEDHEKYLDVNHKYHTLIQEMTGNKAFNDVINTLRQKILLYRYRQLYQPDRFEASMNEHRELLNAFRRRDPVQAEELMRRHLMNQCEALRRVYENEFETTDKQVSLGGST
ncbi:MAG: GntR family transcriptional regulator [Desulfomonile tiedjei]|nr:GntR family transcriptional regulator [Desulfomonile tiedjei]